jgi:hypothetical protein
VGDYPGGGWTENPKKSVLSVWQLSAETKFTKLSDTEVEHDSSLFLFGRLAVTSGNAGKLHLFDTSDPAHLVSRGVYSSNGWTWPDLSRAAGDVETGLWAPLGQYGLETIAEMAPAK